MVYYTPYFGQLMQILEQSSERFSISNDGWKRMNAGRKPEHLIREAISNAFDVDGISKIDVKMWYDGTFNFSIEDDSSEGISDHKLMTTVFMTDKVDDITKRGRKGRGIKELLAVADYAEIDSVGFRVVFDNGRTTYKSDRTHGTKIIIKANCWNADVVNSVEKYLKLFIIPSNISFSVNGARVSSRKIRMTLDNYLNTHKIVKGLQQEVMEWGNVNIVNLAKGERIGWLYELGIPVQQISTRFHVDVQMRIPLNDNRDVVSKEYLNVLYASILKEIVANLSMKAITTHQWINDAFDSYVAHSTKVTIAKKLFGDISRTCYYTNNAMANDVAKQHGFEVVNTSNSSEVVRQCTFDILKSSIAVANAINDNAQKKIDKYDLIPYALNIINLTKFLSKASIGLDVNVDFFSRNVDMSGRMRLAQFEMMDGHPTISFNVNAAELNLHTPMSDQYLSTLIHELAHNKSTEHGAEFYREVERINGLMAATVFRNWTIINELIQ